MLSAFIIFGCSLSGLSTPQEIASALPTRQIPTLQPAARSTNTVVRDSYHPPQGIVKLAGDVAMTAKAREIFFATHPVIDTDRNTFDNHCQTQISKNNIELGCYTPENRIYILNISDPTLRSDMGVVAAHEMLHTVYGILSETDQAVINRQLETALSGITDKNLLQRLKDYNVLEPGERDNELHSILGTEYAVLGSGMEQYYRQYFSDGRLAVLAAAKHFNQIFIAKENELVNLQNQIKQLRGQMQAYQNQHNYAAYNKLVPQFNSLVNQFNQGVKEYNSLTRALMGVETPATSQ